MRRLPPETIAGVLEAGLDATAFLFLPILVFASRGAAALVVTAGVFALARLVVLRSAALRPIAAPAVVLAALIAWSLVSAPWSITPGRSIELALRLAGMFGAALALAAAAPGLAKPRRLFACFVAGLMLGLLLIAAQIESRGALSRPFFRHPFSDIVMNQASDTLAMLIWPTLAILARRSRAWIGIALAAAMAAAVLALAGTAAKFVLTAGLVTALLLYAARAPLARLAALIAVLAIVTAPLTLPQFARAPAILHEVDAIKHSASHRLLIWSFVGDRIAERPFLGWGLDAARSIPGGRDEIRPFQTWLPLHPHNAALQLWLELGVPGATLFAALLALLWLRLAAVAWPRRFAAAAGASLLTAITASFGTYGIWQEWWIGTLGFVLFLVLVMARLASGPAESVRSPGMSHQGNSR